MRFMMRRNGLKTPPPCGEKTGFMKIHGKPCNTTECTLTIVIIYLSVIIPSFFGFEGSRRATANATCAKFCYHFQVRGVRNAED